MQNNNKSISYEDLPESEKFHQQKEGLFMLALLILPIAFITLLVVVNLGMGAMKGPPVHLGY